MKLASGGELSQLKATHISLRSSIFKASSWIMVGHFSSLAIRFVGILILSRIFTPDIFGVLAIVSTVQIVAHLFTDVGVSQAIIQSPHGQERAFLNTAWTIQVVRGFIVWGLGILAAIFLVVAAKFGWLAGNSVYAFPELPLLLIAASFSAVIMGFQTTKVIVANRNLDIWRVTLIDLTSQFLALVFTVVAGLLTRSIWSYIAAGLLTSLLCVLFSQIFLKGPPNRPAWDAASIKDLSRFGGWVLVSSALGGGAANSDRMLLGGIITPAMLGLYSIASNLVAVVDGVAGRIFGAVALPTLSNIRRSQPERFNALFFRIRWLVDAGMIGLSGFLFATSHLIVAILYDPRYVQAGPILQILSLGLLFARYNLAHSAYLALGLPSYLTLLNVTKLVSICTLIPVLFYLEGQQGAIFAIAFHMVPVVIVTFYLNSLHRLNNLKLEFTVLGAWPIGWLMGVGVLKAVAALRVLMEL
jgi:O-antigen/teichoic acid export membrane protein